MTQLSQSSVTALQSTIKFAKVFAVEIVKVCEEIIVGIDETPTIALFIFPKEKYTGPELFLNRLKVLDERLASSSARVVMGSKGTPVSIELKKGRSIIDFRLANNSQGKRLPGEFKGNFAADLVLDREQLREVIEGTKSIGSKTITFHRTTDGLSAFASNEGENFKYQFDITTPFETKFSYTYAIDHLTTVDKQLPKDEPTIVGKLTAKGQMQIAVETHELVARVFIFDIKNR